MENRPASGAAEDANTEGYVDRYLTVGALRLHLTDWNPDSARVVVLVHGLSVQCHTWDPIAADLASAGYRVICPDNRGHGLSDWAGEEGYPLERLVDDLEGIVDQLELDRFELVGHSLGCRIAIVFASRRPDQVLHLALSDAGPEVPRAGMKFSKNVVVAPVRGFRDEAEALEHYRGLHPEWRSEFLDLHVRHQLRRNWAGKLVFRADPETMWLLGSAGSRDNDLVWRSLDALPMPVVVMWGRRSDFFTEELAQRMIDRLAQGRLVRTDTGHYIPREDPDEFLRILYELFGSAAADAGERRAESTR